MSKDFKARMKQLIADIEKGMEQALSRQNLQRHADELAEKVKVRTRVGYGTIPGQPQQKLKPLKQSTIDNRSRAKRRGDLSSSTSPSKSNLTHTGQLLDSTKGVVVKDAHIRLTPSGNRRDGGSNLEVGKHVTEQGRPYIGPSRSEQKALAEAIREDIVKFVNRILTKRR